MTDNLELAKELRDAAYECRDAAPPLQRDKLATLLFTAIEALERQGEAELKAAKALHEAVAAIYFNDSADYLTGLWQVVKALDQSMADLLEEDEQKAYERSEEAVKALEGG